MQDAQIGAPILIVIAAKLMGDFTNAVLLSALILLYVVVCAFLIELSNQFATLMVARIRESLEVSARGMGQRDFAQHQGVPKVYTIITCAIYA